MPVCSTRSSHRFRSRAATARVLLACTIGTSSTGTTCTVRRMPSIRTTSALRTARARSTRRSRRRARSARPRNTDAGSVECTATRSRTTSPRRSARSFGREVMPPRQPGAPLLVADPPRRGCHATSAVRRLGRRPDVLVEPRAHGLRRVQQIDNSLLRLHGAQPRPGRPVLPRDEPLVTQQIDARMILWIALRRGLQRVVRADFDLGLLQRL